MLVTAAGLGLIFVPLSLVALSKVGGSDTGVASSLLNTGQQLRLRAGQVSCCPARKLSPRIRSIS
jgi:hypothetical protein